MAERTPRDQETRAKYERPAKWMPPQLLPDPTPEPGYAFRWIRVGFMGKDDARNVSSKLREGWEPVKASEHPEIQLMATGERPRFPDSIEIGGLLLCKTPTEFVDQRNKFYEQQAESQMTSVDNHFMSQNDPRMPVFKERRSEVRFGSNAK
jgi:hypothetical protein